MNKDDIKVIIIETLVELGVIVSITDAEIDFMGTATLEALKEKYKADEIIVLQ